MLVDVQFLDNLETNLICSVLDKINAYVPLHLVPHKGARTRVGNTHTYGLICFNRM